MKLRRLNNKSKDFIIDRRQKAKRKTIGVVVLGEKRIFSFLLAIKLKVHRLSKTNKIQSTNVRLNW